MNLLGRRGVFGCVSFWLFVVVVVVVVVVSIDDDCSTMGSS